MIAIKDIFYFINKKIMGSNFVAHMVLLIIPPYKYLFGKQYNQFYKAIVFKGGIRKDKLLCIAHSVRATTLYYSDISQKEINSLDSFEKAFKPFDKEVMVQYFKNFLSSDFSSINYELMTTGGTSGPASQFYVSKSRYKKEYAFYHKIWSTLGYKGHLRGVIRNEKLDKDKAYKINPITKEVIFDGFRNNEQYYEVIYKTIIKFNIKYLQGYPSSIYNFFLYLNKTKQNR
jgi:phenylacetate-CoA ligase